MKKYLLVACALGLTACGSSTPETPFPGEFANADYVLSDTDAQKWVAMSNQTAQCIYPNLTRIQKEHFSKEDAYIHAQYQFKRFKDQPAEVESLTKAQCETLRAKARDDLAVVKGQYKSGMVEETKSEPKNTDGVATGENKFFFDIIKWGSALLL